jgi:hypothetical protein
MKKKKQLKFVATQFSKEGDSLFKHIFDDTSLYVIDEETDKVLVTIEGRETLERMFKALRCKVVAL